MDFEIAKALIDAIPNGRIFKVDMTTNLVAKVSAKAKKMGINVFKHTVMPCRKGIEYSNTNYIKQISDELGYIVGERANGTKDTENVGFADSKLNNKLLDLFAMDCKADRINGGTICTPKVEFIVDDNGTQRLVSKAELKEMGIMQNSFFTESRDAEKYERMVAMRNEWEKDKANYPIESKVELAKLIRDMYNKMFSVKVENINSIG